LVVHNENDANDIVQEAFLRVFCKLSGFSGESAFYTWFYRIVYNLAVDFLRRPYRKRVEFDRLETLLGAFTPIALPNKCTTRPDETVEGLELRQRIATALAELSVIHREVVILREVWGMSYEEMAQRLGCAKGTIMSRLHHARRRLQISLRDVYEAEYGVDGGKAVYETACK
jgi:RNA polymerase sigma-70 factor (ECF subfamily)